MKKFETPAIEVMKFAVADVITTSNPVGGGATGEVGGGGGYEDED